MLCVGACSLGVRSMACSVIGNSYSSAFTYASLLMILPHPIWIQTISCANGSCEQIGYGHNNIQALHLALARLTSIFVTN